LIILKVYNPAVTFWKLTYPVVFVTSDNERISAGWTIEETMVSTKVFPSLSLMQNANVPFDKADVGVAIGVTLGVGVGVLDGDGVGVAVGAGAVVTVNCVVAWALKYPDFKPLAVMVQLVVIEKLGAVKLAL
jgi:hypothetical protein